MHPRIAATLALLPLSLIGALLVCAVTCALLLALLPPEDGALDSGYWNGLLFLVRLTGPIALALGLLLWPVAAWSCIDGRALDVFGVAMRQAAIWLLFSSPLLLCPPLMLPSAVFLAPIALVKGFGQHRDEVLKRMTPDRT